MDYLLRTQNWCIAREWLMFMPGVLRGLSIVMQYFARHGDGVVVFSPIYPPFYTIPKALGLHIFDCPLQETSSLRYAIHYEHLERLLSNKDNHIKLLLLSNPQNPSGQQWSETELKQLASLCAKYHVLVISDEIHSGLMLWGKEHIPFARISNEAAMNSITFCSASKTYNVSGFSSAWCIIPNPNLREYFYDILVKTELGEPSPLPAMVTQTVLNEGDPWRKALIKVLENNVRLTENVIKMRHINIKVWRPDASFLVWLDFRSLGLSHEEVSKTLVHSAHLALNDGLSFGENGRGFMRLNVGCPESMLLQALHQLVDAFE